MQVFVLKNSKKHYVMLFRIFHFVSTLFCVPVVPLLSHLPCNFIINHLFHTYTFIFNIYIVIPINTLFLTAPSNSSCTLLSPQMAIKAFTSQSLQEVPRFADVIEAICLLLNTSHKPQLASDSGQLFTRVHCAPNPDCIRIQPTS